MLYNLSDLFWQYDWRGNELVNLRIRVCKNCLDRPQQQLRPIILPPDPVPRDQPRPENYAAEDAGTISAAQAGKPPNFNGPLPQG